MSMYCSHCLDAYTDLAHPKTCERRKLEERRKARREHTEELLRKMDWAERNTRLGTDARMNTVD